MPDLISWRLVIWLVKSNLNAMELDFRYECPRLDPPNEKVEAAGDPLILDVGT